jgi:hypothetical protein
MSAVVPIRQGKNSPLFSGKVVLPNALSTMTNDGATVKSDTTSMLIRVFNSHLSNSGPSILLFRGAEELVIVLIAVKASAPA